MRCVLRIVELVSFRDADVYPVAAALLASVTFTQCGEFRRPGASRVIVVPPSEVNIARRGVLAGRGRQRTSSTAVRLYVGSVAFLR